MRIVRSIMAAGFICLFAMTATGQSIKDLQIELDKLEAEKVAIAHQMESNLKQRQVTETELKLRLSKIANTQKIVSTYDQKIGALERDINISNATLRRLWVDQGKLRREYADMVRSAYKNYKLNNFLLFLFAADDFNDATRRVDFMRRYNSYREEKAMELRGITDSLSAHSARLGEQKAELDKAKGSRTNELSSLRQEEKRYRVAADELKRERSTLTRQQQEKEKQIAAAQARINELIAEEARKAKGETLTAAQQEYNAVLTGRFDQNQGKLPYPARGAVIIEKFGSSPGGNLSNPSKGVKMTAKGGSQVNSVFEGSVSTIFAIPGMNNGVIVRHGNYLTVYANLTTVSVKKGDRVSLNQKLGNLPASDDPDNNYLHFEICRMNPNGETVHLNPEQWLHR